MAEKIDPALSEYFSELGKRGGANRMAKATKAQRHALAKKAAKASAMVRSKKAAEKKATKK
jgi:uncharacterized protein YdaU (DUF1376 family)